MSVMFDLVLREHDSIFTVVHCMHLIWIIWVKSGMAADLQIIAAKP